MEEVGEGVMAEDADIVQNCGTTHGVTVQVQCVPEEVDLAIAHVRADKDSLGRIRMKVGETCGTLHHVGQGVKLDAVAWEPVGIIHQEHPAPLSCGGTRCHG